jgi:hypothetical protein
MAHHFQMRLKKGPKGQDSSKLLVSLVSGAAALATGPQVGTPPPSESAHRPRWSDVEAQGAAGLRVRSERRVHGHGAGRQVRTRPADLAAPPSVNLCYACLRGWGAAAAEAALGGRGGHQPLIRMGELLRAQGYRAAIRQLLPGAAAHDLGGHARRRGREGRVRRAARRDDGHPLQGKRGVACRAGMCVRCLRLALRFLGASPAPPQDKKKPEFESKEYKFKLREAGPDGLIRTVAVVAVDMAQYLTPQATSCPTLQLVMDVDGVDTAALMVDLSWGFVKEGKPEDDDVMSSQSAEDEIEDTPEEIDASLRMPDVLDVLDDDDDDDDDDDGSVQDTTGFVQMSFSVFLQEEGEEDLAVSGLPDWVRIARRSFTTVSSDGVCSAVLRLQLLAASR